MRQQKKPKNTASDEKPTEVQRPEFRSREECLSFGKGLRDILPRKNHAYWKASSKPRDPIEILEESNRDRLPELVPIRYGRMLRSPFTFLRGSSGLMAYDLAATPDTKIQVQACGDCHLLNFGLFATPERNLVFDINDFVETLPAPWEWDVKRLAVSFAVAARANEGIESYRQSRCPTSAAFCLTATVWKTLPSKSSASAVWAHAVMLDYFFLPKTTPCSCNSRRPGTRCWNLMQAKADMTIKGSAWSLGNA